MTMFVGAFGRDPERLVIWLDDEMFALRHEPGTDAIFYGAAAPGLGGPKSAVLRALLDGTQYSLLLSDESTAVGTGVLSVFNSVPEQAAEITYDKSKGNMPGWITDAAWAVIQRASRVQWLLDVKLVPAGGGANSVPTKEEFELFKRQLRAVVLLRDREAKATTRRMHAVTVVSQIPKRELNFVVRDQSMFGLEPNVFHQTEGSAVFRDVVAFLEG